MSAQALTLDALARRAAHLGLELRARPDGSYLIGHAHPSFEPLATAPDAQAAHLFLAQADAAAAAVRALMGRLLGIAS